jgi:hypothetical protein
MAKKTDWRQLGDSAKFNETMTRVLDLQRPGNCI